MGDNGENDVLQDQWGCRGHQEHLSGCAIPEGTVSLAA